jgi:hypothetical protein
MSVKRTVASRRTGSGPRRVPVKNSSTSSSNASESPIQTRQSSWELDVLRPGDLARDPAPLFDLHLAIPRSVEYERRHADGGQHRAHVDVRIHPIQRNGRAGAGALSEEGRDAPHGHRIAGRARRHLAHIHLPAPFTLEHHVLPLALLGRGRPGVVRAPQPLRIDAGQDERAHSLRMCRREEGAHVAAF